MKSKNNIKLAVSPLSWTNDDMPQLGGEIAFETCIAEMARAGYCGCELGNKFPRDSEILKKHLHPMGLSVASGWFSCYFTDKKKWQQTIEDFENHLLLLKNMQAKIVVVAECHREIYKKPQAILSNRPVFNNKEWDLLLKGLDYIGNLAKKNNLTLSYHYHMGTGIQEFTDIQRLMHNTNPLTLGLLLDTGHGAFAGISQQEILSCYGNRINHVHLKDIRKNVFSTVKKEHLSFLEAVKKGIFTVPGDGDIDFTTIFSQLLKLNYQGWWVVEAEQDPALANPYQMVKKARDYIYDEVGV